MEIEIWNNPKDSLELFRPISHEPYAFLFYHRHYHLCGYQPFLIFKSKGPVIQIETPDTPTQRIYSDAPLLVLKRYSQNISGRTLKTSHSKEVWRDTSAMI